MKLALLIQAHKEPSQIARMCRRMAHSDIDIYISVDAKSDIIPFREQIPCVRFVEPRIDVKWGGVSQVEATLSGLEFIMDSGVEYDYVAFISGQDYPLVSPEELLRELQKGCYTQYLSYRKLEAKLDISTLRKARYYNFNIPGKFGAMVRKVSYNLPFIRRNYPFQPIYKGSGWWTLSRECISYILRFTHDNPSYLQFHRNVHCCDEFYFHNIVMHSPFAHKVECDDKRYIEWIDNRPNPKILGVADYNNMMSSGDWFARKLDMNIDSQILDMIDQTLS